MAADSTQNILRNEMLRSLDLFTGIGGITRALEGFATPILYCENEPRRHEALQMLFDKRKLPPAPIHKDVSLLDGKAYRGQVDLVAGGWPCVGFSTAGKKQGFLNAQSAMFKHFIRLVQEVNPDIVFQENVPGVLQPDAWDAISKQFDEAGYDIWYLVLPAHVVGSPQERKRWYCLGVRRDIRDMRLCLHQSYERHDWSSESVSRMNLRRPDGVRVMSLGNSVVPDAVRLAFMLLFTGFHVHPNDLWKASELVLQRPTPMLKKPYRSLRAPSGLVGGERQYYRLPMTIERPDMGLLLLPDAYQTEEPHNTVDENLLREPSPLALWGTPRARNLGSCNVLTKRARQDILTQLRFERNTPDELRAGYANEEWMEWLMGYAPGWTEYKA